MTLPTRRLRACVESWPEAETGSYDPHCCRFPKSCSATIYDEDRVADSDLEPATTRQTLGATPRVWPQIMPPPDDISDAITVEGVEGTWYRATGTENGVMLYRWERTGQTCTVLQLRQIGAVREVLS